MAHIHDVFLELAANHNAHAILHLLSAALVQLETLTNVSGLQAFPLNFLDIFAISEWTHFRGT